MRPTVGTVRAGTQTLPPSPSSCATLASVSGVERYGIQCGLARCSAGASAGKGKTAPIGTPSAANMLYMTPLPMSHGMTVQSQTFV